MLLKPQDVVVILKLASISGEWTYATLAASLGMSVSETHAAVRRAQRCRLLTRDEHPTPIWSLLQQFLTQGLPFVMPLEKGSPSRGMPTSYAGPPFSGLLLTTSSDLAPVWPHSDGEVTGVAVAPLYPSVPEAAKRDPNLREWLVIADALRSQEPRTRQIAMPELEKRIRERTQRERH